MSYITEDCIYCGARNYIYIQDIGMRPESFRCYCCMNIDFILYEGLFKYMSRTVGDVSKAYEDMKNGLTITFDGQSSLELEI